MIKTAEPFIGKKEIQYVLDALQSGWVSSQGQYIEKFENGFCDYIGNKFAVSCSNGTTALHLALASLGLSQRDEVIIPNLTFVSPASMTVLSKARPVFCDVDPDYWCIDPAQLKKSISKDTKAIIAVHLYGHPAKMDEIMEIAANHELYVIEDCAEAHGALFKGKKAGSFSDISCFSFYGNKIMTTGEGGICLTNNEELYDRMLLLRDHGMKKNNRYWHEVVGFNYRMTNLQAALGFAQLEKIDTFIEKKRAIASLYSDLLLDQNKIFLQKEMSWARNVYWFFSIIVPEDRDKLRAFLYKNGVDTRTFFYPVNEMPPYKNFRSLSCPTTKYLSRTGLNLPSGVLLKNEDIEYISKKINEFLKRC